MGILGLGRGKARQSFRQSPVKRQELPIPHYDLLVLPCFFSLTLPSKASCFAMRVAAMGFDADAAERVSKNGARAGRFVIVAE